MFSHFRLLREVKRKPFSIFEDLIVKPEDKVEDDQHDRGSDDKNNANDAIIRMNSCAYIEQGDKIDAGSYQIKEKECTDCADNELDFR